MTVLAVDDQAGQPIRVHVEIREDRPACRRCGTPAWVKDRPVIELVDLPCFGCPARLVWYKHRYRERFHRGLVMYAGRHVLSLADDTWTVPISTLWS